MARKKEFPLAQVYGLPEPGPAVLLSTAYAGRFNVTPMAWHVMMEFVPPLVGCAVRSANFTFEALRRIGECVINIRNIEKL
jgi:flavin reductase (DIM6/NTAB) family NADH-FMN oxidoreductase RutF